MSNDTTLFARFPYKFPRTRKPLLFAGRARQFYGLESANYKGDYDLIVSPEDFEILRDCYPCNERGELGDPRVSVGDFEFYKSFDRHLSYDMLVKGAHRCGDHLVVSLCWLWTMAVIVWKYDSSEKHRVVAEAILDKLNAAAGGERQ